MNRWPGFIFAFASLLAVCPAAPVMAQDDPAHDDPQIVASTQPAEAPLPELKFPAYYTELDKARAQMMAGRYELAIQTLAKLRDGDATQVALIKAAALAAIGQYQPALAALSAADVANQPLVIVQRACLLSEMGQLKPAITLLQDLAKRLPDSLETRYYLAHLSELAGDLPTARIHYDWIYKTYYDRWIGQGSKTFDDARQVTLLGRALDRWATLNSAYAKNAQLHNLILGVFVAAFDRIDRTYWPAHVAAAEYFLSHNDAPQAAKELAAALAGNPRDQQCHLLLGQMALEVFNFDQADKQIAAIRKVNPASLQADLLEARNLLHQRRPVDAQKPLLRILDQQPDNIEGLGLSAACHALQLQEDKLQETLSHVQKIDPRNASAYLDLADQLGAMRQYPRAEAMYKLAIDHAPWLTAARNGLGLLLTQSGDEDQARTVLQAAYALDPFNYRTINYLILLDNMARLTRVESPHFVVLFDPKADPLVGEYFPEYLESIHSAVCQAFAHQPAAKTYIEVFPTHDAFSARITGAPWIGTVGASTGRVIALCAPRQSDSTMGTFNWAQVLRHEYTHTVTLSATENRIAHWMTEGLAVGQEQSPIPWDWVPMLFNAVKNNELFTMDQLTWAFVRPKRPIDRTLAYAQSFWVCQYIAQRFGQPAILKMMEQFRAGKSEEEVFSQILNLSTTQFHQDFTKWAGQQVAGWGYDKETSARYQKLVTEAQGMIDAGQYAQSAAAWEQILTIRPMDPLPHQRLAGLYLSAELHQPAKALEHLIRLEQVSLKDNRLAKRIARLYAEQGDWANSARYAMRAVYTDPGDRLAHELAAKAQEQLGNQPAAAREQRAIVLLAAEKK